MKEFLKENYLLLQAKISRSAGGVDAIVEIINSVDRATEKSIIENLEEDDPELAEEIKKTHVRI